MLKVEIGTTTVYYTRGFELISRREKTIASYYVYDGGLSVRALTNEAGAVTDTLVFDAFGNETGRTGTTDNPYGFQGEEQDATGLYYLRARYMDPATGTFTTMDTYGGSLSDPMSLHKYLFANSNPIKYCDPSGHYTLSEQETAMAIQGFIGEALSGIFYFVDLMITDPTMENHTTEEILQELVVTMLIGFCLGFCGKGAKISPQSQWAFKAILGAFGVFGGISGGFKAYGDYKNGLTAYALLEAVLSVFSLASGITGLSKGFGSRGPFTSSSFSPYSGEVIGGHNLTANETVLGPFSSPSSDSYIDVAKRNNMAYFDMGDTYDVIKNANLDDSNYMFKNHNAPFLDDRIRAGNTFNFTVDPDFLPSTSATVSEYNYLTDPSLGHNYVKVPATSSEFAFSLVPVSSYGG